MHRRAAAGWQNGRRGRGHARRDEPARFRPLPRARDRLACSESASMADIGPTRKRFAPVSRSYRALWRKKETDSRHLSRVEGRRCQRPGRAVEGSRRENPSDGTDRVSQQALSVRGVRHDPAAGRRVSRSPRHARSYRGRAGTTKRAPPPAPLGPSDLRTRVSPCPCGRGRCSWQVRSAWRRSWRRPSDSRSAGPTWRGIPPASARIWCRDGASAT